MRILRVITRLDVAGGAELSTVLEAEGLAQRGHSVRVVTLSEPATARAVERLEVSGVECRFLPSPGWRQVLGLRRVIEQWRPDVVHAVIFRPELVTAFATVGRSVPTVVSLVNMQYAPEAVASAPSPRRLDLLRRLEGFVLRHGIDHFHCLTAAGEQHSVEHLGIEPFRITVVPRGRRREQFHVDPEVVSQLRDDLLDGRDHLVVNVGRHELQKGQDLLVVAVDSLGDAGRGLRVVIAGREGNGTEALHEQLRRRGLDDTFRLLGARSDVAALLAAADVVCVTSRWEGLGGSIIEALGAGAPVVAFAVPAVSEVLGDAGVAVPPFDTDAFADAIRTLIGDEDRRRELSDLARARFDTRFEMHTVLDMVEQLYVGLDRRG